MGELEESKGYFVDVSKQPNESKYKGLVSMDEIKARRESEIEPDYLKLLAAHKVSERRIKIRNVEKKIAEERVSKIYSAILAGVAFTGLFVLMKTSGLDTEKAIEMEKQAIFSVDALKEYLGMFTPGMWLALAGAAAGIASYSKHNDKQMDAQFEYDILKENDPLDIKPLVESDAKKIR